jgi:hypothetical protein
VAGESLRDELLAVPGVTEAEVEDAGSGPSGVRVKLDPDADAGRVGIEVQRVLAAHGLSSRMAGDPGDAEAPPPIVGFPAPGDGPSAGSSLDDESAGPPSGPPESPDVPAAAPAAPAAGLAAVRVEESREEVVVTAIATDGRTHSERTAPRSDAMLAAVVAAVATLAEGRPPAVLALERTEVDGSLVVTVVLERADGSRGAGASVVRASQAFAAGKAAWSAARED